MDPRGAELVCRAEGAGGERVDRVEHDRHPAPGLVPELEDAGRCGSAGPRGQIEVAAHHARGAVHGDDHRRRRRRARGRWQSGQRTHDEREEELRGETGGGSHELSLAAGLALRAAARLNIGNYGPLFSDQTRSSL